MLTGYQGLEKTIPDSPKGQTPVHLKDKQAFADHRIVLYPWEKDVGIRKDGKTDDKQYQTTLPDPNKPGLMTPTAAKPNVIN